MLDNIIGIDEAGRGPLCGPVCACALILPNDFEISILNDSKKLSEKKREEIYLILQKKAIFEIALVDEKTIDEINILQATFKAMEEARTKLLSKLSGNNYKTIVDGNKLPKSFDKSCAAVVKADQKYPSVMAASIIAKVTRDRILIEKDKIYPEYGFKNHKGYGTKKHYEAISKYGITSFHRKTFLKKILN